MRRKTPTRRRAPHLRRQIDLCRSPAKSAYPDEHAARNAAAHVARMVIADGLEFADCYGYVCPCGAWHLTMDAGPDRSGRPHVLLKSVPAELQEWARAGTADAWRVMDDDDIERLVL